MLQYKALYLWVREHKPLEVLECGTGKSTIAIAMALASNGVGRVTSIEESEKWFIMAKRLLPPVFEPFVEIIHSDVTKYKHGYRYERTPLRPYDFVFVDGPQRQPNFDILYLMDNGFTSFETYIDKRTGTVEALQKVLGEERISLEKKKYLQLTHIKIRERGNV